MIPAPIGSEQLFVSVIEFPLLYDTLKRIAEAHRKNRFTVRTPPVFWNNFSHYYTVPVIVKMLTPGLIIRLPVAASRV